MKEYTLVTPCSDGSLNTDEQLNLDELYEELSYHGRNLSDNSTKGRDIRMAMPGQTIELGRGEALVICTYEGEE